MLRSFLLQINNCPPNADGESVGGLALIRRFLCNLIPQQYILGSSYAPLASYGQFFNPFVFKLAVRISPQCQLHPYLLLAGGVLLAAIEGRQN